MQTRNIPRLFVFIFGHLDNHHWAGIALPLKLYKKRLFISITALTLK